MLTTKTNPDNDFVEEMKQTIKDNNGFCGELPFIKGNKCKCKQFKTQNCEGYCLAGLYYKEEE